MEMSRPQYTIRTMMLVTLAVGVLLMLWRVAAATIPAFDKETNDLLIAGVGLAAIFLLVGFMGWWSVQ